MSLLSSLLAFSSLNSSFQREERSLSANSKFFFDDDSAPSSSPILEAPKCRTASKSLTKMDFYSNNKSAPINPKSRCLHRIAHNLNRKVKKHYYSFFVTLESMKKNNIRANKMSDEKKDRITQGFSKFSQTVAIVSLKYFENCQKITMWNQFRDFCRTSKAIATIDNIFINNQRRIYEEEMLKYLKDLGMLELKTQILVEAIEGVQKRKGRQIWEQFSLKVKEVHEQRNRMKMRMRMKVNMREKAGKIEKIDQIDENEEIENNSPLKVSENISRFESPQKKIDSLTKTAKRVLNLIEATSKDTVDGNLQPKMYKSFSILVNYQEKPYNYYPQLESIPKILPKQIPQEFNTVPEIGDIEDKSSIFRDMKTTFRENITLGSEIDKFELSNVVGESFSRIDLMINDLQRKKENRKERSQISYIPFLPCESSVSSVCNRSETNFGSEAVSFKNSLVLERESMKGGSSNATSDNKNNLFKKKGKELVLRDHIQYQQNQSQRLGAKNIRSETVSAEKIVGKDYLMKCEDDSLLTLPTKCINLEENHSSKVTIEYSSEQRTKNSLSFTGYDIPSRRLKFNEEFSETKRIEEQVQRERGQIFPKAMKNPSKWKNQLLEKKSEMRAVRDIVGEQRKQRKQRKGSNEVGNEGRRLMEVERR